MAAETQPAAGHTAAATLALMMFLAPALGVPHEEMLQDTLKSIIVSFGALLAGLLFLWAEARRGEPLRWHAVLALPLLLMAYALGSMAWSHTYLAGAEAIRWFVFALLAWLALHAFTRERLSGLAWGVHGGAVVASLWAAMQFWGDLQLFPQGPNPGSTFVNRNFFAEYAVCTLPFSVLLLVRARRSGAAALLAITTGLIVTAILMTGTRSALIALSLQVLIVWPLAAWRFRAHMPLLAAGSRTALLAGGSLLVTVLALGSIPSGNAKLLEEQRGATALQRSLNRAESIGPRDESLAIRMVMWQATGRMIQAHPLAGVGAGAWESQIPLFQAEGAQLETDYYAHNEYLQLLAEYGLVGWVFLVGLAVWTVRAVNSTWTLGSSEEGLWRTALLSSLLALAVVSNVGFAWRMAATGALFALCIGALAASDARARALHRSLVSQTAWTPALRRATLAGLAACTMLATYITVRAAESEQKIVRATKLALAVSAGGQPEAPQWQASRREVEDLIREGVQLNPHYRKITPMVADEMAKWGDWKNATWIWESTLASRPYIVAILTNAARGHAAMGDHAKAFEYLERARRLQPAAPAVRSLEVVLLARTGRQTEALQLARAAMRDPAADVDVLNAASLLGWRSGDFDLAAQAMELKAHKHPRHRAVAYLELGNIHAKGTRDATKAEAAYRAALASASPGQRSQLLRQIPPEFRGRLAGLADSLPPPADQTSSSRP